MFGRHWVPAQGTVVASHVVKTTGDGLVSIGEYVVDVRTDQGEVFRAKVEEPRIATNFLSPAVETIVKVEFDSRDRDVRFDKDDPAVNLKAARHRQADTFDDTLAQPPGTRPEPPGR